MNFDSGEIMTRVRQASSKHKWLIGLAAFYLGVVSKWSGGTGRPGLNLQYLLSVQGFGDFLASIFGQQFAKAVFPSWSGGATFSPQFQRFFGPALYAWIAIQVADTVIDGSEIDTLKKVLSTPLLAYAVGKIFDPPGSPGVVASSSAVRGAGRGGTALFAGAGLNAAYGV